ncbi:nitroreductase [Sphingoaurantiacus capsulatus]|uniref:Putative NAD(P)H nitroreductase n=1 Tax=Sphingoaurantiacus capsulatus TaxID=1771310 RepID=A0ABV7X9T4_9SPHN
MGDETTCAPAAERGGIDMMALLSARRSPPALSLSTPGPDAAQLSILLGAALRVPDHGRMSPWRFIILEGAAKDALADRLDLLAGEREDAMKARAGIKKLRTPPLAIAVASCAVEGRIPEWEQILSAGALCQNVLLAATALGFGGNWVTGWYAYDERARAMLGLGAGERIAGFILIGTPLESAPERPRPAIEAVTTWLDAASIAAA